MPKKDRCNGSYKEKLLFASIESCWNQQNDIYLHRSVSYLLDSSSCI